MPTQLERRTATQEGIIDAVISLSLEHPGMEPSFDAVADQAGVAKSTVVYHFQNRLGLLQAVAGRLHAEMAERLGLPEQYGDAPTFVRAFLNEARHPTSRVYQQVTDQIRYTAPGAITGGDTRDLMDALDRLGVTEQVLVMASAVEMVARQVAVGLMDSSSVDAFVDELFELDRSRVAEQT